MNHVTQADTELEDVQLSITCRESDTLVDARLVIDIIHHKHKRTLRNSTDHNVSLISSHRELTVCKLNMSSVSDMTALRETWKQLYSKTLPQLARARDPAQPKWPVTLDHCFARIILDNTVGRGAGEPHGDVSWDKVIGKPAVQKMSEQQLRAAIELGERIRSGEADLVDLDERSLRARGKWEGKYDRKSQQEAKKRKREEVLAKSEEGVDASPKKLKKEQSTLSFAATEKIEDGSRMEPQQLPSPKSNDGDEDDKGRLVEDMSDLERELNVKSNPDLAATYKRIQRHPNLTPYRRRLYTILLSVPRGRYTTYQAMSDWLSSSARAVGSGMRNNPFAPDVPCHRVLASDGTIGGFGGDWDRMIKGKSGRDSASEKVRMKVKLLESEGVKFDSKGQVKGPVFKDFHEDQEWFDKS